MASSGDFEQLILHLMSPDNNVRGQAEKAFNDAVLQAPDKLIIALTQALRGSNNQHIRELSTILLRKTLISKDSDGTTGPSGEKKEPVRFWTRLSGTTQEAVKEALLVAVEQEPLGSVRKKLGDTISELALFLTAYTELENSHIQQQWPQLLPFLFRLTNAQNEEHRKSALDMFSKLCLYLGESLRGHFPVLKEVLTKGLNDQTSLQVRLAALGACVSFVQLLEESHERQQFKDFIPMMFEVVSSALNAQAEQEATDALQVLVELADVSPAFLRPHLSTVINAMLTIANTAQLSDSIRQLGLEFLVTLAETKGAMVRKQSTFVQHLVPVVLNFMLDIDDDPEWITQEDEEDEDVEVTNRAVGEECLDRLSLSLGGKTIAPILFNLIPGLLQHHDWKHRHTALMAIALIGEGCKRFLTDHLDNILSMITPSFGDQHPRVRWAACNTFGQMSTDFGPGLQQKYHAKVIPPLVQVMDDKAHPKVQSHAASAVINFAEHSTPDILEPYLDVLMAKLAMLLQSGNKMVLEQAITAIAAIADVIEGGFTKFYDTFMPFLKNVLQNANGKELRLLRGKAMECISLVAVAVGKEKFAPDARSFVDILVAAQQAKLDPDDPLASFLLQAWARVCKAIGSDFVPYLQVVMPPLLTLAKADPDLTISGTDDESSGGDGWEYIPIGDKRIGINTSLMEEKATACNMIYQYAAELKGAFFPYVEEVASVLIPLVKFYFNDAVRSAAVSAMPSLLESVKDHLTSTNNTNNTPLLTLFAHILTALNEAIQQEIDTDILLLMIQTLTECVDVMGDNAMNEPQLRAVSEMIKKEIAQRDERMQQRLAEREGEEDYDEEEAEKLQEENEKEEEVLSELAELMGKIARYHKASFLRPFSECLFPVALSLMHPNKSVHDRQIGLCLVDDVVEFCEGAALPLYQHFLPAMVNYITDPNPSIRQAAVYGIGLCVQFGGLSMGSIIPDIWRRLESVVTHSEARHEDNVHATENAVSAMGKVLLFHSGSVDMNRSIPVWLQQLPVQADKLEARVIYKQLLTLMNNHWNIFSQHIPKVLSVFGFTLGTRLVEEDTTAAMVEVSRRVASSSPDVVRAALAAMPAEHSAKFQAFLQ